MRRDFLEKSKVTDQKTFRVDACPGQAGCFAILGLPSIPGSMLRTSLGVIMQIVGTESIKKYLYLYPTHELSIWQALH